METVNKLSTRDEIIAFLQSQPENISVDEIMYHLYVIQKVQKGQSELAEGKYYTDDEVEAIFSKWLK